MKQNPTFTDMPKPFWAYVRAISQKAGYTQKGTKQIKVPTLLEIREALRECELDPDQVGTNATNPSKLGTDLLGYFQYRADALTVHAKPNLMDAAQAETAYKQVCKQYPLHVHGTMNKQSGDKAKPAYFTNIINTLISAHIGDEDFDSDPRELTIIARESKAVRTLSRRVDGAFPSALNPIAILEIKEYYYTTTFGSRIADGIYESVLDGLELEELAQNEAISVKHYVMIDAYNTWWNMGKPYLCRFVDMLNMGYADEILFGQEVIEAIPRLAKEWVTLLQQRRSQTVTKPR